MRSDPRKELHELIEATRTQIEDLRRRGFREDLAGVPLVQERQVASPERLKGGAGGTPGGREPPPRLERTGSDLSELKRRSSQLRLDAVAARDLPRKALEEVRAELGDCTRCKLHRGRTQIVFGVGNPKADLVFVGEAPGRDEDLQGEPFVGRAGKLLTEIIEAIGLKRQDVYICNVIKCRPPENRNPEPEEIGTCQLFLRAQLRSIQPKIICMLGKVAAQTLLELETPISALRGRFFEYNGIPAMVTYHPAYLLRNPASKREVWEDMKQVHAELCRLTGREIPRKGK